MLRSHNTCGFEFGTNKPLPTTTCLSPFESLAKYNKILLLYFIIERIHNGELLIL